jgi:hypothetical protein
MKGSVALSYEDQEYHRRRSEIELDQALSADADQSALAHLTLARLHRARRQAIGAHRMNIPARPGIFRTDKES